VAEYNALFCLCHIFVSLVWLFVYLKRLRDAA
jgi:hypothetical protein